MKKTKEDYNNDGLSPELKEVLQYLDDVETVKASKDEHQVAMLVEKQKLCWEHVPTWMRKSKDVCTRLKHECISVVMLAVHSKIVDHINHINVQAAPSY